MILFDYESINPEFQNKHGSAGAPIKHEWIRYMKVNDAYPIPDGIKQNTLRCFCHKYGLDSGKKFKVSFKMGRVIRVE